MRLFIHPRSWTGSVWQQELLTPISISLSGAAFTSTNKKRWKCVSKWHSEIRRCLAALCQWDVFYPPGQLHTGSCSLKLWTKQILWVMTKKKTTKWHKKCLPKLISGRTFLSLWHNVQSSQLQKKFNFFLQGSRSQHCSDHEPTAPTLMHLQLLQGWLEWFNSWRKTQVQLLCLSFLCH